MSGRTRNIKPGFFTNELLAECPPLARILFAGLWCHANRDGRLEDRPTRLKALILPYDDCDVDEFLNTLAAHDFIVRYRVAGHKCISVREFLTHQSPHPNEAHIDLPAEPEEFRELPVISGNAITPVTPVGRREKERKREREEEDPETEVLKDPEITRARARYTKAFEEWYAVYPRHQDKGNASTAYGREVGKIAAARGISRDFAHAWLCEVTRVFASSPAGQAGTFCPLPATWLNGARYDDDQTRWQITNQGAQRGKPPSGPGQRFEPGRKLDAI